ncbi:hypothetical protein BJ742DRAFT_806027 [Cladochytrium replicatum]|nr:hypothetical protein BJ742DRAFT_806027 [Cladochytrium replicatum]
MFFGFLALNAIFPMSPESVLGLGIIGNSGTFLGIILPFYLQSVQLETGISTASAIWRKSVRILGWLGVATCFGESMSCLLRPILTYVGRIDEANSADMSCSALGVVEYALRALMCIIGIGMVGSTYKFNRSCCSVAYRLDGDRASASRCVKLCRILLTIPRRHIALPHVG